MVKKNALTWVLFPLLLLAGCGDSGPDYGPIGEGLKAVGICLVAAAVVRALAELVINDNNKSSKSEDTKTRRRGDDQSKGGDD